MVFNLHLGLPFVDVRERLGVERGEKAVAAQLDQTRLRVPEFARSPILHNKAEATMIVPPGSRMSIGVTMALIV